MEGGRRAKGWEDRMRCRCVPDIRCAQALNRVDGSWSEPLRWDRICCLTRDQRLAVLGGWCGRAFHFVCRLGDGCTGTRSCQRLMIDLILAVKGGRGGGWGERSRCTGRSGYVFFFFLFFKISRCGR